MTGMAPSSCEALMKTIRDEAAKLDRLLRRTEAAKYITATYGFPCSPKTLAKLACVSSDGPPFRMAGRTPLYPVTRLDAWALNKLGPLVRSTSETKNIANAESQRGHQGADLDAEVA
jgi:hypothetical protein